MNARFTIGQAARAVHMTAETLRHYDRIGLVKPGRTDPHTQYRCYTAEDLVRLNAVHALQQMDLPLKRIREVLACDDLRQIVAFLDEAQRLADEKIAALQYSRSKIARAREDFEKKLRGLPSMDAAEVKRLPRRVILLSDTVSAPTLDILWSYLSRFYDRIDPARRSRFTFEDLAGIHTENGVSRLFAVCVRYEPVDGLRTLPEGRYLCAGCTEENRAQRLDELLRAAREQHHAAPGFHIQQIAVSGVLQWSYQLQIPLEG